MSMNETINPCCDDVLITQRESSLYDFALLYANKIVTKDTIIGSVSTLYQNQLHIAFTYQTEENYVTDLLRYDDGSPTKIASLTSKESHTVTGIAVVGTKVAMIGYWEGSSLFVHYNSITEIPKTCVVTSFMILFSDTVYVSLITSQSFVIVNDIVVDSIGNFFLVGQWIGTELEWRTGSQTSKEVIANDQNSINGFLIKVNLRAQKVWVALLTSSRFVSGLNVDVNEGFVAVTGVYQSDMIQNNSNRIKPEIISIDNDGSEFAGGYLALFDTDGGTLWLRSFVDRSGVRLSASVPSTGRTKALAEERPIAVKLGSNSVNVLLQNRSVTVVARYDLLGIPIWLNRIIGTHISNAGKLLAIDIDQNLYASVMYSSEIRFGNGLRLEEPERLSNLVAMYRSDGSLRSVFRQIGVTSLIPIHIDQQRNVYISGSYSNLTFIDGSGQLIYRLDSPLAYLFVAKLIPYIQLLRLPPGTGGYRQFRLESAQIGSLIVTQAVRYAGRVIRGFVMLNDSFLSMRRINREWEIEKAIHVHILLD